MDFFDTVLFLKLLNALRFGATGSIYGKERWVSKFGCPAVEVQKARRIPLKADPRVCLVEIFKIGSLG